MKKILLLIASVLSCVAFCGCASLFSKTEYDVCVSTNAPDAIVTIRQSEQGAVISEGKAPHVVNLKTSDGFFEAQSYMCEVKSGKRKQVRTINTKINPLLFGNFIFGGLIGIAVDGATGACYKFDTSVYVHFSEFEDQ